MMAACLGYLYLYITDDVKQISNSFLPFFPLNQEFMLNFIGYVGEQNLAHQNVSLVCGLFRVENNQGPIKVRK